MTKKRLVCGNYFNTTITGRYKYCSEKCAKSRNNNNYISTKDISTMRFNEPMQVELEGDGAYGLSEEFWILGLKTMEGENNDL